MRPSPPRWTDTPKAGCPAAWVPVLLAAGLALGGCATGPSSHGEAAPPRPAASSSPEPVGAALQQPLRDLSLLRAQPAEVLLRAAKAPYELAAASTCASLADEIATLDAVLGADVDTPDVRKRGAAAGDLALGALRGAVSLPFRGAVRTVTGAEERDRLARRAVLAGVARRGFLKGAARAMGCAPTQPSS